MALPTVQLTGTIFAPDAQAKRSGLTIRLAAPLVDAADKILVAADSLNVRLDGYGKFALPLVPSDAAGLAPSPVPYVITEQWGDRRSYNVFIPSGVGTVDLANLVPVANPPVIPNLLGVEASNREAADAALDAAKVNRAGDSMTGDLAMAGHRVTGLADPVGGQDAATKAHVAAAIAALVNAAPSLLDTLGEIATALTADESAAAALTTLVGTKATTTALATETARAQAAEALLVPLTQKGVTGGVASLDGSGTIPDAQIPASIARDTEVTSSVAAAVAALVNAAPSTLDTLGELAAALQTDESAAAALTTAVGQKLNVIVHGSTAGTARMTGAPAVLWIGTVAPTNAATNDVWFDKTTVLFKLWTGTVWSASGTGTYLALANADVTTNRRRITSLIPAFTPGTDHTNASIIHPWSTRGQYVTVQNIGSNDAKLYKGTSAAYWFFTLPSVDTAWNITLSPGQEYIAGPQTFLLSAISPLGTTLQVILETEADAA